MRKICNVCDYGYMHDNKSKIPLDLAPPVCSSKCLESFLYSQIVFSTPIPNTELIEYTKATSKPIFRSILESRVHDYLTSLGFIVLYEAVPSQSGYYLPDFMVIKPPFVGQVFIEAKGIWGAGGRNKVRRFREELSQYCSDIFVIDNIILRRFLGKS